MMFHTMLVLTVFYLPVFSILTPAFIYPAGISDPFFLSCFPLSFIHWWDFTFLSQNSMISHDDNHSVDFCSINSLYFYHIWLTAPQSWLCPSVCPPVPTCVPPAPTSGRLNMARKSCLADFLFDILDFQTADTVGFPPVAGSFLPRLSSAVCHTAWPLMLTGNRILSTLNAFIALVPPVIIAHLFCPQRLSISPSCILSWGCFFLLHWENGNNQKRNFKGFNCYFPTSLLLCPVQSQHDSLISTHI